MIQNQRVQPANIDPKLGAILWEATYMTHHMSTDAEIKRGMLEVSRRYFRFAQRGPLRDAAIKRKHTDRK